MGKHDLEQDILKTGYDLKQYVKNDYFSSSINGKYDFISRGQVNHVALVCGSGDDLIVGNDPCTLRLNLIHFFEYDDADHIYVGIVVSLLKLYSPNIKATIDVESLYSFFNSNGSYTKIKMVHRIASLFSFFFSRYFDIEIEDVVDFPVLKLSETKNTLVVRTGRVELRALRSLLLAPADKMQDAICELFQNYNSEKYMYKESESNDVEVSDIAYTLRQLITNAGFYSTQKFFLQDLKYWGDMYLSGMNLGVELYHDWGLSMHEYCVKKLASKNNKACKVRKKVRIGSIQEFYENLSNKNILFVTSFAEACNYAYNSGKFKNLWKSFNVPDFEFKAVSSFVSTYPNRPHSSWCESFKILTGIVEQAIGTHKPNVIMGACGAYGIPLMEYVYKKFGITSIYLGNISNLFFGVRQNAFIPYLNDANLDFWTSPYLKQDGTPTNYEYIDDGRYLDDEI